MGSRDLAWKAVGASSGALAGIATRKLLQAGWRRVKGGNPPTNPASPSTTWSEAIVWAVSSGVALAVTRLVAQRGAAEAWRKATGAYPASLEAVSP